MDSTRELRDSEILDKEELKPVPERNLNRLPIQRNVRILEFQRGESIGTNLTSIFQLKPSWAIINRLISLNNLDHNLPFFRKPQLFVERQGFHIMGADRQTQILKSRIPAVVFRR